MKSKVTRKNALLYIYRKIEYRPTYRKTLLNFQCFRLLTSQNVYFHQKLSPKFSWLPKLPLLECWNLKLNIDSISRLCCSGFTYCHTNSSIYRNIPLWFYGFINFHTVNRIRHSTISNQHDYQSYKYFSIMWNVIVHTCLCVK